MSIGRDLIQHIFTNYVWYDSISNLLKGRLTCKQIAGIVGGYPDRDNKFWISYFYNIECKYSVPIGTWLRVLDNFPSITIERLVKEYDFLCSHKTHRRKVDKSVPGFYIDGYGVLTRINTFFDIRTLFLNDYLLQWNLLFCPNGITRRNCIELQLFRSTTKIGDDYHTIDGHVYPNEPLLKLE